MTARGQKDRAIAKAKKDKEKAKSRRVNSRRASIDASQALPQRASSTAKVVSSSTMANFARALSKPFAIESLGCRVPDPFSFPTACYHAHKTFTVNSSSFAGSTDKFCFMVMPNPIISVVDVFQAVAGGAYQTVSGSAYNSYGPTSAPTCFKGLVSSAGLAADYSTYRVVSTGIKLSNLQPALNATGRLFVAQVPIGDTMPSGLDLTYASADPNRLILAMTGLTTGMLNSTDILELPSAREFVVQDIMTGDIAINPMVTNPAFYGFKTTQAAGQLNATYSFGDDVQQNAAAGSVTTSFKDLTRCNGGSAILVYGEGFPPNSSVLQIEHIIHLEGSPIPITGSSTQTLVPSATPMAHVGSTAMVEQALGVLAKQAFQFVVRNSTFGGQLLL